MESEIPFFINGVIRVLVKNSGKRCDTEAGLKIMMAIWDMKQEHFM
jgi:hypothetical protein